MLLDIGVAGGCEDDRHFCHLAEFRDQWVKLTFILVDNVDILQKDDLVNPGLLTCLFFGECLHERIVFFLER